MATYCVSDIHGEYAKYIRLLQEIGFSDRDTLYVIGDMVDRGPQPMAVVRDMMRRENVIALAGNHDLLACIFLKRLIYGGREEDLDEKTMADILLWQQDGGASTLEEFQKLTISERREVVEWLEDLDVYREIEANGERYVLVHAGLGANADPARPLDDYELNDYLLSRPDYGRMIFPDKYIVSGHTPTGLIPGNPKPGSIYRANRHIAIDCGCTFGGYLGAIKLETGEEFYV